MGIEIRRGSSRLVLLIGAWALKLPHPSSWRSLLWGLLSNLAEAERRGLEGACPVVLALPLGLLLVQRRADPLPEGFPLDAIPAAVRALAGHDGGKLSSYGLIPGRIVAVDYHGDTAPVAGTTLIEQAG